MGFIDYVVDYFRGPAGEPGPAGPAGEPGESGTTDWNQVQSVSASPDVIGDGVTRTVSVFAPSGTRVISGGYYFLPSSANITVYAARVAFDASSYEVRIKSDTDDVIQLQATVVPS